VEDARGIAAVHVRTWQHAYRRLLPDEVLERLSVTRREEFWRSQVQVLPEQQRPWVAELEERITGFVSAGPSRDEDATSRVGEVYAIYVDPDCWSRGIGRHLMDHAHRDLWAHGYTEATLWVLAGNRQAREFYEARGWRPDGATRKEAIGSTEVDEVRYRISTV
jgi:ribosomal protein S18 acetylase RimI-like enzyme